MGTAVQTQNGQPREKGSREVAQPKGRNGKAQEKCERAASFILRNERGEPRVLLETIVTLQGPRLLVAKSCGVTEQPHVEIKKEDEGYFDEVTQTLYKPMKAEHVRQMKKLTLPPEPESYGTPGLLIGEIERFLDKYLSLPTTVKHLVPVMILASWVTEISDTAPIIRLIGPKSSGKSTFWKTAGRLMMKPLVTYGVGSVMALVRNIDRVGVCTLIIDEAENEKEASEVHKFLIGVLKVGYDIEGSVDRCFPSEDPEDKGQKTTNLNVYGFKVMAAIKHATNAAYLSRSIPIRMRKDRTRRKELPRTLMAEIAQLQAMLLQFRIERIFVTAREQIEFPENIDPRVIGVLRTMAKVAHTDTQKQELVDLAGQLDQLMQSDPDEDEDRDAAIAAALHRFMASYQERPFEPGEIAAAHREGDLLGQAISAEEVGSFFSDLGIPRKKSNGRRRVTMPWTDIRQRLSDAGYEPPQGEEAGPPASA